MWGFDGLWAFVRRMFWVYNIFFLFVQFLQPIQRRQPIKMWGGKKILQYYEHSGKRQLQHRTLFHFICIRNHVCLGLCVRATRQRPHSMGIRFCCCCWITLFTSLRAHRLRISNLCCSVEYNVNRCVSIRSSDGNGIEWGHWKIFLRLIFYAGRCTISHRATYQRTAKMRRSKQVLGTRELRVTQQCSVEKQDYLWLAFVFLAADAVASKNK